MKIKLNKKRALVVPSVPKESAGRGRKQVFSESHTTCVTIDQAQLDAFNALNARLAKLGKGRLTKAQMFREGADLFLSDMNKTLDKATNGRLHAKLR